MGSGTEPHRGSTVPSRGNSTNTRPVAAVWLRAEVAEWAVQALQVAVVDKDWGRDTREPGTNTMLALQSTTIHVVPHGHHGPSGLRASEQCHGHGNGVYRHASVAALRRARDDAPEPEQEG